MEETLSAFIDALTATRSFEEAASVLLSHALDSAEHSLENSTYERGRILRSMVHLRPSDGYVGLIALDTFAKGGRSPLRRGTSAHVPSATAWRFISAHQQPVSVDVVLGEVSILQSGEREAFPAQKLEAQRSQAVLVSREVTHLLAVPLRSPGGQMDGMLAVEASCQSAVGEPFIWGNCAGRIETLAAIAAPYLARLPASQIEPYEPDELLPVIGNSMQRVVQMLRVFAEQEETILLGGPTGAGKTRLARWCHERSPLRGGPFEGIDLATVPEELQMGELFGWRRGAFTGASKDNPGCIGRAENGTLFVDEIDKLSLRAQAGLLRVLEEKRYRPLGDGAGDKSANVRFVIGTNADLGALVKKGLFREDLYYRINVLPLRIPSLRDRRDEIVPWAQYMLRRRHSGGGQVRITPEGAKLLEAHDWPGNLRQLDNIVRRAYTLSLVTQGIQNDLVLRDGEVKLALEYEAPAATGGSVWAHMEKAAEAYVAEAEKRCLAGHAKLDMDHADAFKALVIEAARRKLGGDEKESLRKAFVLLGKETTVEGRNHSAFYKREMEKLAGARAAIQSATGGEEQPIT
ncbi:MAG: sigma-54-dependent Fis family transcriptional regulator [Polyangiaceae bacterium]|nr:sigma-54-dependent Fis family transcriptional regulator [Polyangiaceae bacterium]